MRKIMSVLLAAGLSISLHSSAQSNFFFSTYSGSTNLWSSIYMQVPTILLDALIGTAIDADNNTLGGSLRFETFKLKNDDGSKINIDNGSYWGFKKKDMFRNFQYGLKFGWQPELSPFGIYVTCAYQHRQFKAQFNPTTDDWSRFKLNYVRPGIGIRVTPCIGLLEEEGWSPIVEIGTAYNYNFKCSAPGENPKKQFNNGVTTSFGAGVRFESISITAGVEIDNYNLFNKNYTPDEGITYPYSGVKSKHLTIFLSLASDF